ncbi:High-affinity methionine permease [Ceratocystis platani]|uniref:High-affinity methionine permease n=1 Tax=Ceratocystis fimbriata f. sp. platani TaxID=88771 RepID=A0A0F8DIE1_CERFI|nr:High-affinity methionine permease [Ceratocystis platani]
MAESAIHLRPCAPNYIPLDTDHSVPAGVEDNREDDNGDDFDVFRIPEDRKLGVMSTALLIVNRMVGTGIFSNPASVIKGTKSVGASLIFWVLGALMTLAGLFMYLEFGTALPRSGGEKVYCKGWQLDEPRDIRRDCHCCIHAFMPHTGIYIGNVLGAFKLLLLLFVICSGFAALAGHRELDPRNFSSFDGGTLADPDADTSATAAGYANALLQVLYSYSGWENANYVLTEVRNPERTLKRAAPIATIIVMTFYVLANIAYFAVFQRDTMAEEGIVLAPDFFKSVYGDNTFTSKVMPAFLSISAMGNIFAQIFAMPRVKQELAKQGILPFSRFFSSDWPSQAPSTAILLHWFFSVVLILGLSKPDTYTFMTNIFTYSDNWIKLFLAIGLLYLTWTPSEEWAKSRTTFRNYPPVTMFYVLSLLFTLGVPFVPNKDLGEIPYWVVPTLGTGMLFVGAAYWLVWAKVMPLLGYHVQHEIEVMHDGSERVRYHFETKS